MKTVLCKAMAAVSLLCLMSITVMAQTQPQTLTIGTLINGKAQITQPTNAERLLKANLPANVTLSDIKLEYSEYDKGYYVTARVGNNEISSVGILLYTDGSNINALRGPGVQITCSGYNCNNCRLAFSRWVPYCKCDMQNPPSDMRCDMHSTVTIGF